MHKNIKAVVIKPDSYSKTKNFPVVYLLHGYSDSYSGWVKKVPSIVSLADQFQLLIVCPDGNFDSWYFDSPVDSSLKYETYISKELVQWIDKNYQTIALPKGRAITGLSMGGHGALYNAFRHQDVFGAAGSMSGGVDLRPFPNNWGISNKLGLYSKFPERWDANSVINLTYLLTPRSLSIIIDCGTEDFFYGVNMQLHEKLLDMNIPHDFISRPGGHTWEYWGNAVRYQLMFFSGFFNK
jgi:S-formylglutathione hydrolase FrmB